MKLAPSLKGQLTKAVKTCNDNRTRFSSVKKAFRKLYPPEQAKHATRKYLQTI